MVDYGILWHIVVYCGILLCYGMLQFCAVALPLNLGVAKGRRLGEHRSHVSATASGPSTSGPEVAYSARFLPYRSPILHCNVPQYLEVQPRVLRPPFPGQAA